MQTEFHRAFARLVESISLVSPDKLENAQKVADAYGKDVGEIAAEEVREVVEQALERQKVEKPWKFTPPNQFRNRPIVRDEKP